MKRIEKSTFHQSAGNPFYRALLKQDKDVVCQFLEKGEKIPELLYMQITNHDHLALLKFLLSFEPEKKLFALELSLIHGAIECFNYLQKTCSIQDMEKLKQITPRKNVEAIKSSLEKSLYTEKIDFPVTETAVTATTNWKFA